MGSKVLVMESSYETCREAVDRAFSVFPVDVRGKKVVVKMNALTAGDPYKEAMCTHYKLLEAVIKKVESLGPSQIVAGDSVGAGQYGNSEWVFRESRLKEAAGPYYRNFNKNLKVVEMDHPFKNRVALLRDVLEADVYISVPKMKTHGLTRISGAIKNNFGLVTGARKAFFHYHSVTPEAFARVLVDLYRLATPDLVIMDAILAMEGYGPTSPETRWVNKILASNDGVALDTIQAKIIGFSVDEVPTLRIARDLGLGETDLNAIEVIGDASTIKEYHRPDLPEASFSYRIGDGTRKSSRKIFAERVAHRPRITAEKCHYGQGCTACVDVCPCGALTRGPVAPVLDPSLCLVCCACKEACDFSGLEFITDEAALAELAKAG